MWRTIQLIESSDGTEADVIIWRSVGKKGVNWHLKPLKLLSILNLVNSLHVTPTTKWLMVSGLRPWWSVNLLPQKTLWESQSTYLNLKTELNILRRREEVEVYSSFTTKSQPKFFLQNPTLHDPSHCRCFIHLSSITHCIFLLHLFWEKFVTAWHIKD